MILQAYNFLASWQMVPEESVYEWGEVPKSCIYKIEADQDREQLNIMVRRVLQDNRQAHDSYSMIPDGNSYPAAMPGADSMMSELKGTTTLAHYCYKDGKEVAAETREILPDGRMRVVSKGLDDLGNRFTNEAYYHKQLSVLPYAASVSGAIIRPTEEGVIKGKALQAMEEQTNMHLEQIRKQVELLAKQAYEIQKRREISMIVYNAKMSFSPVIGKEYHLYEKHDGSHVLSLVGPGEWGIGGPFRQYVATVRLLADHTWVEVNKDA